MARSNAHRPFPWIACLSGQLLRLHSSLPFLYLTGRTASNQPLGAHPIDWGFLFGSSLKEDG